MNADEQNNATITSLAELCTQLQLPLSVASAAAHQNFPLRVPRVFVEKMQRGDSRDPLLLQVLPTENECLQVPGFTADPLGEIALCTQNNFAQLSLQHPQCLQKYAGRLLVLASSECNIHCRFCFRRHFFARYEQESLAEKKTHENVSPATILESCKNEINELILSGGDPFLLSREALEIYFVASARSESIKRLRIHSRAAAVDPRQIDADFLELLDSLKNAARYQERLAIILVLHINHPREIDALLQTKVAECIARGVTVLAQSVLLRGVNDDAETLAELCESLVAARIIPYYLHQLDRAAGTAHFEVARAHGIALIAKLKKQLAGYVVPRYVEETPEGKIEVREGVKKLFHPKSKNFYG